MEKQGKREPRGVYYPTPRGPSQRASDIHNGPGGALLYGFPCAFYTILDWKYIDMMMSRFTERAQEALQRAQQIMFAKQHTQLDVEHLFLALLQQRQSLPAQIITKLGGDAQMMTRRLESALNNMQSFAVGRGVTTGYITLRANRVLQGAVEEADRQRRS